MEKKTPSAAVTVISTIAPSDEPIKYGQKLLAKLNEKNVTDLQGYLQKLDETSNDTEGYQLEKVLDVAWIPRTRAPLPFR